MDFRILGPLEVSEGGRTLDLGGPKQRALLALLVLEANRVVSSDRLIAALWDEERPESARKALQVYVSQLRKVLGRDRLVTRAPGYLIRVETDELDLDRFERLRAEGRLDEALALWRGTALAEFSEGRFAQGETARLDELRLATLEERLDRDLAEGRHRELVGELDALARDHPLRERLRAQQMLALYRAGRQADALEAYRQARDALVDELGIEPGRPLRDLHQAILNQDPGLDTAAAATASRAIAETRPAPMHDLPAGTVTLLFADIEGSTKLVRDLGGEFAGTRSRSRELVRAVVSEHRGHEVDWAGDGPFLVFERASDAVAAAADLQRSLLVEPWPRSAPLRMRIGIPTGEPGLGSEGYVGLDVHLAARVCAAAHGGQVVVSRTTRDVVALDPPGGVSFRPLGRHQLKDIPAPETLYQLVAPDLEESFPPLQSLGGAALPALHHRLVGRRDDLERIDALLARPDVRLVTITGPGGAGKSRLALEAASDAAVVRPVHLVGLASISDPDLVPAAIARELGVRESSDRPLLERIADELSGTGTLLVLDNLEHLLPAAKDVGSLLDGVVDLDVLVTSRAPLRLSGEHVLPLEPLSVDDATTLFLELAAARGVALEDEWLPTVREISQRLDGLPLAIELVVAPLAVLPPAQLLDALDQGLLLDMKAPIDLPERQQTLRATIEWSYGLVSACQRSLHGALAVFRGGAPLDALRVVCDDLTADLLGDLSALVDGGLVRRDTSVGGEARFAMLATVREYALESLAIRGQLDEMRAMHADYFFALAREAEADLESPAQAACLERLEQDLDNIRAALEFALSSDDVEGALRAISALGHFWRAHGHVGEARRLLARALERADDVPPDVRATALWWSARQAAAQDDVKAEIPLLERALELFRELERPREIAFALGELGWIALQQGDHERAAELCEEALAVARATGDADAISGQLNFLADIYSARGDHLQALAAHEEALELRRTLDNPILVINSTYNLGLAAWENGEIERARDAFDEAYARASELGDVLHTTASDFMLAELDLKAGSTDEAERRIVGCLAVYTELQNDRSRAECLTVLGGIAAARGSYDDTARLFGAAERLRGDAPLNRFEVPILERFAVGLAAELGDDRIAELKSEGAHAALDSLVPVVAPGAVRH